MTNMTSTSTDAQDASSSLTSSVADFPTEARVVLHGLLKAPDLNGKKGVVRSVLSSAGRHTVFIEELGKSVGLKPSNLMYEPIALDSLSVKEMKMVLNYKSKEPADTLGMDKSDMQARIFELFDSPEELPALLAKAKTKANANGVASTAAAQSQAAQQLGNMSPDQLRQQARMMRTMDPATVRRMNPQLANMTDAQLKMAADRMDMMANNPSMMKMAAEQMAKMDPAQLQKMQAQMGSNSSSNTASAAPGNSTPSVNQAQQAAKVMANMSPEQLKQQAQMLKTMDPDVVRQTNPQMAHMTNGQIKMAAMQFEMMASNPAMMKMATEQMANASPEQLEAMRNGQIPTPGGQNPSSGADMGSFANAMGDPTEMLANIDKTQLKELLNTVKNNPQMLRQYAQMTGMSEDQLKQGVESFAGMDDTKIDAALKMMKIAQKAKSTWDKANTKAGGKLKFILAGMFFLFVNWIVWYFYMSSKTGSPAEPIAFSEKDQYYDAGDSLESEF